MITVPTMLVLQRQRDIPAPPGGLVSFFDDFTSDTSADWNTVAGTDFTYNSGISTITVSASSQYAYTPTQASTQNQFVSGRIDFNPANPSTDEYSGYGLRGSNDTGPAYMLRNANGNLVLRGVNGASGVGDIYTSSITLTDGDYLGLTVSGSGTSTIFHIFCFGATDPALDETSTIADMKTAAGTNWVKVDSANWTTPTEYASGDYILTYNGSSGAPDHTNIRGGDYTP